MAGRAPTFPEPTLVVGLGRVGLAVLSRLGEDWRATRDLAPDPSLRNLRMLHLTSGAVSHADSSAEAISAGGGQDDRRDFHERWQDHEVALRKIVRHMGEGDLPDTALDFAILRACGLIRFRDGQFEVAKPFEAGVVELSPQRRRALFPQENDVPDLTKPVRIRSVRWLPLATDPLIALEFLTVHRQNDVVLDRLLSRTVYRVREGHSPRILTAVLGRMMAWLQRRDPSPWAWFNDQVASSSAKAGDTAAIGVTPQPSPGITTLRESLKSYDPQLEAHGVQFRTPPLFVPRLGDTLTPWPSMHVALLEADFFDFFGQVSGSDHRRSALARVLPVADWEHGFYDSDSCGWFETASERGGERAVELKLPANGVSPLEHFKLRLAEVGRLCEQGLVRMWDRLNKHQTRKANEPGEANDRAETLHRALGQSLELLGDTVVRNVLAEATGQSAPIEPAVALHAGLVELPRVADSRLREQTYWQDPEDSITGQVVALRDRLRSLGLLPEPSPPPRYSLLREVTWSPQDVAGDLMIMAGSAQEAASDDNAEPPGLASFRSTLVQLAHELYDLESLRKWRALASRRAPRLTVYVVADLGEPFCRAALPTALRALHAMLIRALGPIFVAHRNGMDRALHIVPLVSFPNPASPDAKMTLNQAREEEALINESLQIVRRKLEVAPTSSTNVAHVMLQSRVTDNAVHSTRRTIESFRDFVTLFSHNNLDIELPPDTAAGATQQLSDVFLRRGRQDVFATFSIAVAELPHHHLRWYVGNRLARRFMQGLRESVDRTVTLARDAAPTEQDLRAERALQNLQGQTAAASNQASQLTDRVGDALVQQLQVEVSPDTDGEALACDMECSRKASETALVQSSWQSLTNFGTLTDRVFATLRAATSRAAIVDAAENRAGVDRDITHTLQQRKGIGAVVAQLERSLHNATIAASVQAKAARQARHKCLSNGVPDARLLDSTRQAIVDAARAKPDAAPIRVLSLAWLGVLGVIGAPILQVVAKMRHLDDHPNGLELVLGPYAGLTAGLVLTGFLLWGLRKHLLRKTEELATACTDHVEAAKSLFCAPHQRSALTFLLARLELAREAAWYFYLGTVRAAAMADKREAGRLQRSVEATYLSLERDRELRGVRTVSHGDKNRLAAEDTSRFLSGDHADVRQWLLAGPDVADIYVHTFGDPEKEAAKIDGVAQRIIQSEAAVGAEALWHHEGDGDGQATDVRDVWAQRIVRTGDISRWRQEAWLADVPALVEAFARKFDVMGIGSGKLHRKRVEVNLERFLLSFYPNLGFAAQFRGFEGLDRDQLTVSADVKVLLPPNLISQEMQGDLQFADGATTTRQSKPRFDVALTALTEPACWVLSVAHDIQIDSLQNLRRFEHHFERARPPEDRLFPFTPQGFLPTDHRLATTVPLTLTMTNRAFLTAVRAALVLGADVDVPQRVPNAVLTAGRKRGTK